jgi:hypothetical protein
MVLSSAEILMVPRRARTVVLVALLVLVSVGAAGARRRRMVPIHVKMVAYVGEVVVGTRPDFIWPAMYHGKKYTLNVVKVVVFGGGVTPLDIDAAVAPYQVKFQLTGEKTAVQRLIAAPPGQQLRIMGFLRFDSAARYLMLDTVEKVEATPPAR